ncbi:MAG: YCF48-related protein [Phaeodactylibacter sp.]|uniref:YCF48-related protein n=1 Tax=Phaeodactylibacter sp. TaxID=1940289 RepID=UPI0032ED751C
MKTIYALLLGLFFTSATWAQCLEQLSSPVVADWSAAHFLSNDQGWLIGAEGHLFQTLNGGQSWIPADPRTEGSLRGLTFLGSAIGWIVGEGGVIRRTSDGGQTWQQQFSPIGANLNSVGFVFSNLGLVAGDCGTLLRTVNGGVVWDWVDAGTPNNLHTLHWVNTQIVLAAGEGGVFLRSTNGGQTWSSVSGTGTGDHFALEAQGEDVWLSGEGGTYYSQDTGLTWEWMDNRRFYTLDVDDTGRLVGAGQDGLVALSTDNGQTWKDLDLLPDAYWSSVTLTGEQSGYLAGKSGLVAAFRLLEASVSGPASICAGEPVVLAAGEAPGTSGYFWTGPDGALGQGQALNFVPVSSGWYTLSVEEDGCTAQDSLLLEVFPAPDADLGGDVVLCEGETAVLSGPVGDFNYTWSVGSSAPSLQVAAAGTYGLTVENTFGCADSDLVTVEIQENGNLLLDTLLCSGEFLEVNGVFYDEFNPIGTEVLPGGAANGCDSVIIVQIEYSFTEPVTLDTAVCSTAFPFVYAGLEVGAPGDYFVQTVNADGCQQMIFLNVQELQEYNVSVQDTFCQGGLYVWNGIVLTNSGIYTQTFDAVDGCDSTVTLNLTEHPASPTNLELSVCEGETVMVGDMVFGATGSYEVELTGTAGCDSVVNLQLTVLTEDLITESVGICEGETYAWEGSTLSSAGQYQVMYINSAGCDSVRQLELNVFNNPELFIVDTLPDNGTGSGAAVLDVTQGQAPFEVNWSNGVEGLVQTGLSAGTYTVTVTDVNNCSDTLSVTVPMATGVKEAADAVATVWPNPASGQLWVRLPASWNTAEVQLVLYDLLGRPHQNWTGHAVREALELSVPDGAYWLSIEYRGRRQVNQVIVAD